MYPQTDPRESGIGENPMSGKMQNITPEWQTEQKFSVDSAVARVKGKHHDGDVIKGTAILCRQFRWYRELSRPVGREGFSFYKKAETRTIIFFHKRENKKMHQRI